ncbi:MAG: TIGR01777 family protein [Candidatus Omnitrophica bacterium]|nr:TIGR01777 family protein [Candidatus Omnitrophota bacterium]
MKIAVSGSTGFIGSALIPSLAAEGHTVVRVPRSPEVSGFEGVEGAIHLAGEPIIGRWSEQKKQRIRDSRAHGTRRLSEALAHLSQPPKVLVTASAIGFYGDRGEEILEEHSTQGSGFLAEVCRQWEAAADPARRRGIRVVHVRIGVVLSPVGGALKLMLPPFQCGLGGVLGSGRQYMSWIALDDILGGMLHALTRETLQGPVNLVAPNPVTNREFTKTLGRVLSRPTIVPVPSFALRVLMGQMAEEVLLSSARVRPARLLDTGYVFRYPTLEPALRHLFGKISS